jgi:hypothetical protein
VLTRFCVSSVLKSKLERENRRQQKAADRSKLHDEAATHLKQELLHHEELQRQLESTRDALKRRRSYAEKAEKEAEDLELSLSTRTLQEDQIAVELGKLQVELTAYRARMEGIEQELQKARDMTDEITTDRDKARDEARQLREERRQAAEQRRLDEARREGMMRGKLEGMRSGWEDGKMQGYKEGRTDGSRHQHDIMLNKDWKYLQREFPNYAQFEERIPSPESFDGDVPELLKDMKAPIVLPVAKKPRRPPPTPSADTAEEDNRMVTRTVHSSPETVQEEVPIQPTPHPVYQRPPPPMPVPSTSRQQEEPAPRERTRTNIPPPRPIFSHDPNSWQPPTSIPEDLKRQTTLRQISERFRRKPEEISHAPHDMDFAPMAAPGQYPTVATPLPHWETLQPGRAIPTPAGSIHEFRNDDRDDFYEEEDPRNRYSYNEDPRNKLSKVMMGSIGNILHPKASRTSRDIANDPITYQDARSTITLPSLASMSREQSPAPSPKFRPQQQPDRIVPVAVKPPPSPRHSRISMLPDNYIPPLDADGGFSLPPPHELNGSAMQSAINLTLSQSQNPSRNPSRAPSPTPAVQPRSAQRSRDPSPINRLGGSIKHAASAVIHNMPSLNKARDQFRGRSRSPGRSQSPSPIQEARARARSRSRSRPRSTERFNETYSDSQQHSLLRPEDIYIAPAGSGTTFSDNGSDFRGRDPARRYTGMSQISDRNSPISQRSILEMGGALGLTRGGDGRDIGFVTYPNASAANLSMIEEERGRHSSYNPSPSPNMRRSMEAHLPAPTADHYPSRPSGSQRQFSDGSINRRDMEDIRDGWDTSSRYPPPPPSMKSPTSTLNNPPTLPAKSSASVNHPYPWSNRPVPTKLTMPSLLGPQSPATSSKGGFAGIGAGGGYHRRAASAVGPGERSFASPHPSVRLVSLFTT